jgi:hypothetical protein
MFYRSGFNRRAVVGANAVDLVVEGLAGYGVNLLHSSDSFSFFDLFDPVSGLVVEVKRRSGVFGRFGDGIFFPVNKFVGLVGCGRDCFYINLFDDGFYGALLSDILSVRGSGFEVARNVPTAAFIIPSSCFRFFGGFGELSEVFLG